MRFVKLRITSIYPPLNAANMPVIYSLIGFNNYIIIDAVLYRKPYTTASMSCKWQYRGMREIKRTRKGGQIGYYLTKNKKRKFYSLKALKHRLKKNN